MNVLTKLLDRLIIVSLLLPLLCSSPQVYGENWSGYEGGGPRRNASSIDIPPDNLGFSWIRRFDRQVIIGKNLDPVPEADRAKWGTLNGAYGSRNLVVKDGKIAIIAADHEQPIAKDIKNTAWLTLLDQKNGKTVNCVQVAVSPGKAGIWGWPQAPWTDANDLLIGQVVLEWDNETDICYFGIGGDGARYTAYRPSANIHTHVDGGFQLAEPAFKEILEKHTETKDSFGRPRSGLFSIFSALDSGKPDQMEAAHWGPSLVPINVGGKQKPIDDKLPILFAPGKPEPSPESMDYGLYRNNINNRTGFITVDAEGPMIAMGQSWHADATSYYLAHKSTGMYCMDGPLPPLSLRDETGKDKIYPHARPFAKWGGFIAHRSKLYGMSPGTDDTGNGDIGQTNGAGWTDTKRDQGLGLWCYGMKWEDKQENDGITGTSAAETATATLEWGWSRKSTSAPSSVNESWLEADGHYRNKAMLIDDDGALWAAWTRSKADGMELVKADAKGQTGWLLGIGKGRPGHENWPHIALGQGKAKNRMVVFAGNAWHRERESHTLVHSNCAQPAGAVIPQAWASTDSAPLGPPEVAVFDTDQNRVILNLNLGEMAKDVPPNEFFGYTDRSHLVVAGKYVYIGWVSTKGIGEAELVLCVIDLENLSSTPVLKRFGLGFSAAENACSALIDLIASNGHLHALVYRSNSLDYGDHRWQEQILVTLKNQ